MKFLLFLSIFSFVHVLAQTKPLSNGLKNDSVLISGSLLDSKTGKPTQQKKIKLKNPQKKITVDSDGFFSFSISYQPKIEFIFENDTLSLIKSTFSLKENQKYQTIALSTYLSKNVSSSIDQSNSNQEILVIAERGPLHERKEISSRQIDRKLSKEIAGGLGDPIRVITNLPGVSVQSDLSIVPQIRGGSSKETLVFFNGVPILKPYHSLGAFSVFSEHSIEKTTLYLGGFPVKYHNALSGILNLESRIPSMTKIENQISLDLLQGKYYFSAPIIKNKWNFYFSYNTLWYSHLFDFFYYLLAPDESKNENLALAISNSTLPNFQDFQFGSAVQINQRLRLSYDFLIPLDQFIILTPTDDLRNIDTVARVNRNNYLHHLKLLWDVNSKTSLSFSSAYQSQDWDIGFESDSLDEDKINLYLQEYQINHRLNIDYKYNNQHHFEFGIQNDINIKRFDVNSPRYFYELIVKGNHDPLQSIGLLTSNGLDTENFSGFEGFTSLENSIYIREKDKKYIFYISPYFRDIWNFDKRTKLEIGTRIDFKNFNHFEFSPRINLFLKLNPKSELSFSIGKYSQDNLDFYVYASNPNIQPEKSIHLNAEWSYDISPYFRFEFQNYLKYYYDLVVPSQENTGRIFSGFNSDILPTPLSDLFKNIPIDSMSLAALPPILRNEVLRYIGEKKLSYKNQGTGFSVGSEISLFYDPTPHWKGWFSFDLISSKRDNEDGKQKDYNFKYSRPWSVNWVNYFNMPGKHILSLRWKYAAGLPYTKFNSKRIGKLNGGRYKPYNRFDIRLSKQGTLFGEPITSYFEIWNAFAIPNFLLRDSETGEIKYISPSVPILLFFGFEWSLF